MVYGSIFHLSSKFSGQFYSFTIWMIFIPTFAPAHECLLSCTIDEALMMSKKLYASFVYSWFFTSLSGLNQTRPESPSKIKKQNNYWPVNLKHIWLIFITKKIASLPDTSPNLLLGASHSSGLLSGSIPMLPPFCHWPLTSELILATP